MLLLQFSRAIVFVHIVACLMALDYLNEEVVLTCEAAMVGGPVNYCESQTIHA